MSCHTSAAPNVLRIEDKLRDRANIAEGCAWVPFHETLSTIGIATTLPDDLHYWYVDNYGLGFEIFAFVAVAGVTYNAFAGLLEERDLSAHRRWRDAVGPDIHTPIA